MKYKNSGDNRYRVQFMRATEELMDQVTVKEFISYLEENAEFEDYTVEYIDGRCVNCKAYDLKEESSNLHKEFLVTEDGRVFYWRALNCKVELVDRENEREKDMMKAKKSPRILVPWESWLYLEERSYKERCGRKHTEKSLERMKRNFNSLAHYKGMKQLMDKDFGGAIGKPENSWEEHRWTGWSCEDMKKMLDEAGLPWEPGEEIEYISVSI